MDVIKLALLPARLTLRIVRGLVGGDGPPDFESPAATAPPPPPPPPRPKDLDDVTIAHKVESALFRDRKIAKGKVDVNVAEGVVWLRGTVRTPELVHEAEARARAVPEVRGVENLLHLPKTPAQRKSRRSKPRPAARKVTPSDVTGEAPAPPGAELSPRAHVVAGKGREPAPLGSKDPKDG